MNKHQVLGVLLLGYALYLFIQNYSGYITAILIRDLSGLYWAMAIEIGLFVLFIMSSIWVIKQKPNHFFFLFIGFILWIIYTAKELYISFLTSQAVHGVFQLSDKWQFFLNRGITALVVSLLFVFCLIVIYKENELNKPLKPVPNPSLRFTFVSAELKR